MGYDTALFLTLCIPQFQLCLSFYLAPCVLYGGRAWLLLVNLVFSNLDYAISWFIYFSVTLVYEQIEKYFNPLSILSLKGKVEVRNQREGGGRGGGREEKSKVTI